MTNSIKLEKSISMLNPSTLKAYDRNNKKHDERQITLLADTISTNGWDVPIVVDENNVILKGHARLLAALKLGLETVPVIVRAGLSEYQKKAIRIADNKLAELGTWDKLALHDELNELLSEDENANLGSLGFDDLELAKLLADDKDKGDSEEEAPADPQWVSGQPVIQYNIIFDTK